MEPIINPGMNDNFKKFNIIIVIISDIIIDSKSFIFAFLQLYHFGYNCIKKGKK